MMLLGPLAATLIQLGISRSREYLADMESAAHAVPSATAQPATASLFVVNPFAGAGRLTRLFSMHPSTAERIARLGPLVARHAA